MHEVSLCEGILRIVQRQADCQRQSGKEPFERVVTVRLALGERSCVSEEALRFCFPVVARGTMAQGAALDFVRTDDDAMRVVEIEVA